MSRKHFSWLLLLTIAVFALVMLVPARTSKDSAMEKTVLLPQLAAVVNDLDYLRLSAAGGETIATLERQGGSWRVLEASSYAADWDRLKPLLAALSSAEIVEEKTSNPEFYARLGVEDISNVSASGTLIEFAPATGLPALIVGQKAQGREGQYVRLASASSSALIDRELDVPGDRMRWLNRDIIDIADGEVVEVSITHPDGESVDMIKISADDTNFQLQDIPPDREIKSDWSVNSIAGGLAGLSLEEVVANDKFDWSGAIVFSLLTADGVRVTAKLLQVEESGWISLEAVAYQPAAAEVSAVEISMPEDAGTRAAQINDRVSGWAYRIPQPKFTTMTTRMDDLLKPVEVPAP